MTNDTSKSLLATLWYNKSKVEGILMNLEELKKSTLELDDKSVFDAYCSEKNPIQKDFLKAILTYKMQTRQQEVIKFEEFVI